MKYSIGLYQSPKIKLRRLLPNLKRRNNRETNQEFEHSYTDSEENIFEVSKALQERKTNAPVCSFYLFVSLFCWIFNDNIWIHLLKTITPFCKILIKISSSGKCWYWNEDRRKIIRNIFKDELLDRSLRIQRPKIIDALTELKEEQNSKNESKIRTFVHRLREEDKEKTRRMALASKPDSVIVIKSFQENVSNSTQAEKQDEPQDDEEQFELSSDVQSFDDSDDSSNWTLQISDDGFHTCLT
ncbi:uncharacterized protein LOC135833209 isoform X1 [Planococcus citri]|uniref:uncharacterized protein LOC135833209 isoform X1 n=1 Tax=Planococcus citri TaxID=170843 RepID=UPI0031FA4284